MTENILKIVKWPVQSPDLNPVEKLQKLYGKMRMTCPRSESHWWFILQDVSNKIESNTLNNLINRMPRDCSQVIIKGVDVSIKTFNFLFIFHHYFVILLKQWSVKKYLTSTVFLNMKYIFYIVFASHLDLRAGVHSNKPFVFVNN